MDCCLLFSSFLFSCLLFYVVQLSSVPFTSPSEQNVKYLLQVNSISHFFPRSLKSLGFSVLDGISIFCDFLALYFIFNRFALYTYELFFFYFSKYSLIELCFAFAFKCNKVINWIQYISFCFFIILGDNISIIRINSTSRNSKLTKVKQEKVCFAVCFPKTLCDLRMILLKGWPPQ